MNREKTQVSGTALVTGAARRIGAAIAQMLHEAGFDVVIHCHQSITEANALMAALNAKRQDSACVCVANLSVQAEAIDLVQQAHAWKNRLDVLVNNASNFIKTPIKGFDEGIWDALWIPNVKAPFWLSQAAHPFLADSDNGNIVNITDILAEKPRHDYAVYVQTKAALKMQTEALSCEYAPHVRVNAVAPGATVPPEGENALSDAAKADIISKIPLGRWGAPEGIAMAVLGLVSNVYMTGQTVRVDGGQSLI